MGSVGEETRAGEIDDQTAIHPESFSASLVGWLFAQGILKAPPIAWRGLVSPGWDDRQG